MGATKELTRRQRQCAVLRARQFANKEIARELGISPATVAMHLRLARKKLGASGNGNVELESNERQRFVGVEAGEGLRLGITDLLIQVAAVLILGLALLALLVLITEPLFTEYR